MNHKRKRRRAAFARSILALVLLQTAPFVEFEQHADGFAVCKAEGAQREEVLPVATPDAPAVLVELFTSEGCSTCPPADKLLTELELTQPVKGVHVIALSEHVDYWNHLGWKDPFSSAQFSQRQTDYARAFRIEDIYTPQMIVDGRTQFNGSNLRTALEAIAKAARSPKATVAIAITESTPGSISFTVRVDNVPGMPRSDKADVMLAVVEDGLMSKVTRGENSGRDLIHSAVTRKLIKMGTIERRDFNRELTVRLNPEWKRKNMKAVAFVQERARQAVLGVSAARLAVE